MFRKLLLASVLTFILGSTHAQSFLGWQMHDRYFSVYAGSGWTGYIGDLTNKQPFTGGLSHFNLGVEARLYSKIAARAQVSTYKIKGTDKNAPDSSFNQQRNLSFESQNFDWQIQGMWYFLKYRDKYYKRRTYEPYLAIGLGKTYYNPKTSYLEKSYSLRNIGTENESYGKSAWIIPASIGVKASFNEFINISMDLTYKYTFTGYLDDVSNSFVGPFPSDSIQAALSNRKNEIGIVNQEAFDSLGFGGKRGNGRNDSYFFVNFNIEVYLPQDLFRRRKGGLKKEKIVGKPSAYD